MILLVLVMAGTAVFLGSPPARHGDARADAGAREAALDQARQAAIVYAATLGESADRAPGALPCVDRSHPADPVTASTGPGHPSLWPCNVSEGVAIGRLPVRTLDLDPRSADAGESIWYAIDLAFRDREAALPVNPESSAGLTLNDRSGHAAVLMLPGPATPAQNRPSGEPEDYLAAVNQGENEHFFDCGRWQPDDPDDPCAAGAGERTGERVIGITIDALFDVVQRRALAEVESALRAFHAKHGYLPRAVPFGAESGLCDPDTYLGHLPEVDPAGEAGGCEAGERLEPGGFPGWMQDHDGAGPSGNDWLPFIVYRVDPACTFGGPGCAEAALALDGEEGLAAVVAASGRALGEQLRPGGGVRDYLDREPNALPDSDDYIDYRLGRDDNDAVTGLTPP